MNRLTVPQGAALSVGAVLGTGVIGIPALAARTAGPASLVAWVALITLSVPLAATFAALGARYPDAGGVSTYVRVAFGRRAAAVVGWCFYFAIPVGAPPAAMFGAGYVADAFGGGMATTLAVSVLCVAAATGTNLGGVRVSGRTQLLLTAALAGLLLAATLAALPHARLDNLTPFAPYGWPAVASAAAVLVWGFAGWEAVTHLAAEFRRPGHDLPRATGIAVAVVGVLYLGVATATVLVLGAAAGSTAAPLADLLATGVGGPAREVTAVIALLLTFGAMNAYYAGAAKLGAALGRDGALPAWFAHGGAAGEVPRRSLLVLSVASLATLGVVAGAGFDVRVVVLLTTGSIVLVYVLGTAAAVKLLPRRSWARRGAAVALGSVVALLAMTGVYVLWSLAVAVTALVYDHHRHRRRPRSRPAPGRTPARLST